MIRVLEKNIADKISAGEVIERPVSVVKELIENSLDAGSGSITCEIKNGGKTYIRVTDDGEGIAAEDAEKAFLRHATSKISSLSDLTSIGTLGFRGEALASIAAVSHVNLITRTWEEKAGVRLVIHGGELIERSDVGCPEGTTITVTDLFYNTPARREFLGTDAAESRMILSLLQEFAVRYPEVRVQAISQGETVFTTTGDGDLKTAIDAVYRKNEYRDLIPVEHHDEWIKVKGRISGPALSRTNRKDQIFFVNGRPVKSRVLEKAVEEGYRERLFEGRHPVTFLFIDTDPSTIDVNIHPNKKEIRFHDDKAIIEAVGSAISSALSTKESLPKVEDRERSDDRPSDHTSEQKDDGYDRINVKYLLSTMREKDDSSLNDVLYVKEDPNEYSTSVADTDDKNAPLTDERTVPFNFTDMKITGALFDTYIAGVIGDELFLVDQHAAQERIFYEKLVKEYNEDDKPSQMIMTPVLFDVSLSDIETIEPAIHDLTRMGYAIDSFGPNTFRITEIPYFMTIEEAEGFALDFVSEYEDMIVKNNTVITDKLITRACRSAIKANDRLSPEEMNALIKELAECREPFSCPHGRPTFIRLTKYDIEKMFKRV